MLIELGTLLLSLFCNKCPEKLEYGVYGFGVGRVLEHVLSDAVRVHLLII